MWIHGAPPLVMHMDCDLSDYPHVVALFRSGRSWGAISKTNGAVLRFRDPIYRSLRELAMSYFHEYCNWDEAAGRCAVIPSRSICGVSIRISGSRGRDRAGKPTIGWRPLDTTRSFRRDRKSCCRAAIRWSSVRPCSLNIRRLGSSGGSRPCRGGVALPARSLGRLRSRPGLEKIEAPLLAVNSADYCAPVSDSPVRRTRRRGRPCQRP